MESRTLKYVAEACGGCLARGSPDARVARVCTDSRQARAGDLFVALAGERFDGHEFVSLAVRQGAAAVLVEQEPPAGTLAAVIRAANTRQALGQLAARYRRDFGLPIVAVAGSNGKTTTKDLIAAVLRQRFSTLHSEASFNNDVGVPLTLLRLESANEAAVLEAGTNHPGELAPLVRMIEPVYGVITSIGREHLEFFGDLAGVVEEEGWLPELLPAEGRLFVNGDSPMIERLERRTRATVVRVGLGPGNDWRARLATVDDTGTTFDVMAPVASCGGEYRLPLLGRHQVAIALLAIAVGVQFGLTRSEIQRGLTACPPPRMRLQLWETNGIRVLDDAYNANADSMRAALQTLHDLPCAGRRVAVLGDMNELGTAAATAHAEVGALAAELGVNHLLAVGKHARVMGQSARRAGLVEVVEYEGVDGVAEALKRLVQKDDLVLIKASRAVRLEQVGHVLKGATI